MLLVDDVDNKEFLIGLFDAVYDGLPAPKLSKKRNNIIPVYLIEQNNFRKQQIERFTVFFFAQKQKERKIKMKNIDEKS